MKESIEKKDAGNGRTGTVEDKKVERLTTEETALQFDGIACNSCGRVVGFSPFADRMPVSLCKRCFERKFVPSMKSLKSICLWLFSGKENVSVEISNGFVYEGVIIAVDEDELLLRHEKVGAFNFPFDDIKRIVSSDGSLCYCTEPTGV